MKAVAHLPLIEVVAHRIVWSVPIAGVRADLARPHRRFQGGVPLAAQLGMAALTATLISVNWGIYVWAIAVDRTVETALGYYINPLVSIVVGAVVARREARPAQIAAVALAVAAVPC